MIHVTDLIDRLPTKFQPKSNAQKMALKCPAEFLMFGGAAGSLKSHTMLIDALKYYQQPKYRGIIFRKTYPEIEFLVDRTRELYKGTSGDYYEAAHQWKWPWGATIEFRHLDKPKDVHKHQGPEYQFIGFDESTHQPEFCVRYLLNSRMRSTEGIPLRMRLATNPGNIGHDWHKHVFIGPKCIHCLLKSAAEAKRDVIWPAATRKPGTIYKDSTWFTDKRPVEHTTCFIPGRVTDHTLFGGATGEYARKLKGLPKGLQEALLEGCWEAFEGQFFDCFDFNRHIVKLQDIKTEKWWVYWVGIDIGFAHAAVAYLVCKSPDGTVYFLDELVMHRREAVDVALDVQKVWAHDHKIKVQYLSRDAFRHDGTVDLSRAEMMARATGVMYEQAYNDRISGAMLMYHMISNGKMFVAETCPLLINALQTRIHDERDPEDVQKTSDDQDDAYDAARYAIASEINPTDKEPGAEQKELQDEWEKQGVDKTNQMLMYQKLMADRGKAKEVIYYRQRKGRR